MLELYFLITFIILTIALIYYTSQSDIIVEKFTDYYLTSCPTGYKLFYDANGSMMCCGGDIIGNKCVGDNQCSLNGKGAVINCVDMILKEYTTKGKEQCPSSIMNYFEDKTANKKGCTSGLLNDTLTAPKDFNQPHCVIYNTFEDNINSVDSCYNHKLMDEYPCFGDNCKKTLVQPMLNKGVLVAINFTDSSRINHTTYTKTSFENYLNSVNPNWKEQGIDLSKNIQVAEVAKAFYVDKTMKQSDIQL